MLTIAVCDDEPHMRAEIADEVAFYMDKTNIQYKIYSFDSADSLLASGKEFSLIFLDIQMDGTDGITAAKKLREKDRDCVLIFITVLRDYVFEAFDVEAANYLIKPIERAHLKNTLDRVLSRMKNSKERYLPIRQRQGNTLIKLSEILYFEVIGRKVHIHCRQENIDYYEKLDNLQTILPNDFYRCHRSYLINLNYVRGYDHGMVQLENGEMIPLSRLRQQDFAQTMLSYLKNEGM